MDSQLKKKFRRKFLRGLAIFSLCIFVLLFVKACRKKGPAPTEEVEPKKEEPIKLAKSVLRSSLAGRWYPADAEVLSKQIAGFFEKAEVKPIDNVIAFILPHAGYQFSGQTAVFGLKTTDKKYKRVIIIGPSHRVPMEEVLSVPRVTHYETPLGEIPLDVEFIDKLLEYSVFQNVPHTHKYEHSVQIEVPLLQYHANDFELVPIVAGHCSFETINKAGIILKSLVDNETLVIASSDFVHYGRNYSYVPFTQDIPEQIKKLDMGAYEHIARLDSKGFLEYKQRTGATICGYVPIAILLSMLDKAVEAKLTNYNTSGALMGDFTNSVSYLSVAFCGTWGNCPEIEPQISPTELTEEDKKQLLTLARKSLVHFLENRRIPQASDLNIAVSDAMKCQRAAFVTLKKVPVIENSEFENRDSYQVSHKKPQLRGCIGDIFPQRPLYKSVITNAINAGVYDRRFFPVTEAECNDITIEISALTAPKPIASPEDIRIGIDGVVLNKNGHSAVFLPQVAPEQGWDVNQMLTRLSLKAGLPAEAWKEGANFLVFSGCVFGGEKKMRFARRLLIFSYGLFAIAAQTLLFREFITTFEGNDISVGIFFASWFLWVGSAALFVYKAQTIAEKLLKNIEFLFLAYLPAFILQLILIIQARELAGIESYALWSIRAILLLSIVVNAPVSIITGMMFPIACRWVQMGIQSDHQKLAVSHVYIIEAAGSFVGGLGVTVLLGLGVTLVKVFFILALILSSSVFCALLAKAGQYSKLKIRAQLTFLLPLCILICLAVGADEALMRYVRIVKWTKLLPADAFSGSFQTAQAEYLYGIYNDQWIAIREGSVCEALPDETTAGRIAAINLCQNPDAERVLIIGSGLGLCNELLRLPQIEDVTWAHYDNEYVLEINRFIPPELKISDKRFHPLAGDIRSLLAQKKQYYDLVILNLPDATSSVLNRYYTHQFYHQVKEALRPDGVLGVRIAGGENIMGTELINLGASTKMTLEKVFSQLVLTPGEDTWFIASDSKNLTGEPGTLRDRFETIEGGTKIFSGTALLSVYLPDRAAAALENYSRADLPEELLINRDSRPLTHLYSLLLAAKQSGAPVTRLVKHLAMAGPLAFLIPILVFVVLRAVYILKTSGQGNPSSFDSTFLVFSAGSVGIGAVIVLMYLYQTQFGLLYLHIGVISSVFMVGLTTGATLISYLIRQNIKHRIRTTDEILLFAVILVHTLVLATIALWPGEQWTHLMYAIAFILCGLCTGCYFPLAAKQLADSGFETGQAGSKLETADHIGASVGGLLTSLALVPLLGTKLTLLVFVLLILANLPLAALRIYKPERAFSLDTTAFKLRRLAYTLFGIGLSVILCSNLLAAAGDKLRPSLPQYAAQVLAGQSHLEPAAATGQNAGVINYFEVYESPNTPSDDASKKKLGGYIFSSQDLAPEVRGFGGKMNLAIYVDTAGKLINFHIIRSNETPAYLKLLNKWRDSLNEHQLFRPEPFTNIDAVSGATISSEAILSALQSSGHRFATQILGQALAEHKSIRAQEQKGIYGYLANYLPDTHGIYLISAFIIALIVIYRGGFWSRLGVLALNLVLGGIILNAQYSSEQIATVLSLQTPAVGLTGAFLLVIGIPLLVIFFGNIYCGYVCPFGAAQELLSYILPGRLKQPVSMERMRKARFFKYVVLFVLIIVFFLSRNRTTLAAEPLIEIFNLRFTTYDFQSAIVNWQLSIPLIVTIALTGSIFYARFWCRYLCPVGAFLSLLGNVAILKRHLPVKKFGKCEFGLSAKDEIDCLCCDRCRYERRKSTQPLMPYPLMKLLSRYFVVVVLAVTIFVSTVSVSRFLQVIPAGLEYPAALASGGQPRDVDLQRIRTMIQEKKLSNKEAEFYKKVE